MINNDCYYTCSDCGYLIWGNTLNELEGKCPNCELIEIKKELNIQ
jgi:rubrerythrin